MKKSAMLSAMATSLMYSTINLGTSRSFFNMLRDESRMGMHPHRNDVNRHGKPVKKKKGNQKQKTNPYK